VIFIFSGMRNCVYLGRYSTGFFAVLKLVITPTKNNYLASLIFTYTVNVYPQAINRLSSDENKNLSTLNPCDLQIISQQKGVNLAI
jgi:hypothetical protein